MLQSVRKVRVFPAIPVQTVASVGVVIGFFGLLLQDRIHPVVIYLLQLFLSV